MPSMPSSPNAFARSAVGMCPSSHHSPTCGVISFSTKFRTVSRSSTSSSLRRASMSRKSFGSGRTKEISLMTGDGIPSAGQSLRRQIGPVGEKLLPEVGVGDGEDRHREEGRVVGGVDRYGGYRDAGRQLHGGQQRVEPVEGGR